MMPVRIISIDLMLAERYTIRNAMSSLKYSIKTFFEVLSANPMKCRKHEEGGKFYGFKKRGTASIFLQVAGVCVSIGGRREE